MFFQKRQQEELIRVAFEARICVEMLAFGKKDDLWDFEGHGGIEHEKRKREKLPFDDTRKVPLNQLLFYQMLTCQHKNNSTSFPDIFSPLTVQYVSAKCSYLRPGTTPTKEWAVTCYFAQLVSIPD